MDFLKKYGPTRLYFANGLFFIGAAAYTKNNLGSSGGNLCR